MLGYVSLLVGLYKSQHRSAKGNLEVECLADLNEQVEVAEIFVAAGGRVTPHDVLAVYLRGDRDVLANRKSEHIFGMWERETVADVDNFSSELHTRNEGMSRTGPCSEK